MRVLLINGSPRAKGNTSIALEEVAKTLEAEGIETLTVNIGNQPVRGCIACAACHQKPGRCAFSDPLYDQLHAILTEGVDGLVVGSPVYYAGPNGSLCALLDRLFYSAGKMLAYKPGAAVTVCRRGGATATLQTMNMMFEMMNMPVVTSQYWNIAYGAGKGEVKLDTEGMQTMRTLATNMAFLLQKIHADGDSAPKRDERPQFMNFIR